MLPAACCPAAVPVQATPAAPRQHSTCRPGSRRGSSIAVVLQSRTHRNLCCLPAAHATTLFLSLSFFSLLRVCAAYGCARSTLHKLYSPYNGEDLTWYPVTKQMNKVSFQVRSRVAGSRAGGTAVCSLKPHRTVCWIWRRV
jgi:hypothetical protein